MKGKGGRKINLKRWKNRAKTAIERFIRYRALTEEDEFHRMTDMCSWELFPPSFYKTHTDEEIEQATKAAKERIMKMLNEIEEIDKEREKEERK